MPLSLLVLAAVPVTGRRLRGAVTSGVSAAAADAVLRVAWSFVARRARYARAAVAAAVGVADIAAMASTVVAVGTAAAVGVRSSAASCFV